MHEAAGAGHEQDFRRCRSCCGRGSSGLRELPRRLLQKRHMVAGGGGPEAEDQPIPSNVLHSATALGGWAKGRGRWLCGGMLERVSQMVSQMSQMSQMERQGAISGAP